MNERLEDGLGPLGGSTVEQETLLADEMEHFVLIKLAENRGKRHWLEPDVPNGYLVDRLFGEVDGNE